MPRQRNARGSRGRRVAIVGTPEELLRELGRAPPETPIVFDEAAQTWQPRVPNFVVSEDDLRTARQAAREMREAQEARGTASGREAFDERVREAGRAVARRRQHQRLIEPHHIDVWNEESEK